MTHYSQLFYPCKAGITACHRRGQTLAQSHTRICAVPHGRGSLCLPKQPVTELITWSKGGRGSGAWGPQTLWHLHTPPPLSDQKHQQYINQCWLTGKLWRPTIWGFVEAVQLCTAMLWWRFHAQGRQSLYFVPSFTSTLFSRLSQGSSLCSNNNIAVIRIPSLVIKHASGREGI